MHRNIEKQILINSPPETVWEYLTRPDLMITWMGEDEMELEIITDWVVGHAVLIKGFHYGPFENTGIVMQCEPGKLLQYSHLSSVSGLPDSIENYTAITFGLRPENQQTVLLVSLENFPTESIYNHLNFYWAGTLLILKKMIEQA